jgi:ribosomal protein L16 Arg81 hydroxylase
MQKTFQFIICIFGVSILFSCGKKIENAETKIIDSLLTVLDNSEKMLEEIDFEKVEESAKIASENLEKIKPLINDTLNRDKVFLMSNYAIVCGEEEEEGGAKKGEGSDYEEVREKYMEKELELCKKQLKNLKHDFSSGEMDEASFKKYYEVEKEKALQIISFIAMESTSHTYRLSLFDSLHPLVIKLKDSLETAAANKK